MEEDRSREPGVALAVSYPRPVVGLPGGEPEDGDHPASADT